MLTPPAPAGVAENSSSPVDESSITALLWTFTPTSEQYGSCWLVTSAPVWTSALAPIVLASHEPGAVSRPPIVLDGANSP